MPVLAHAGGIDEILIFVVPALLAVVALGWAAKRAQAKSEEKADEETADVD